jgi:pimeloyl-ACP methyl ester carboxylesterase
MHGEVANPWIMEFIPRLLADDLNQWGETAKAFVESCVAYPDEMPQLTKYAWMGGVSGQHPQVRLLALPRGQDESALLSVKDTLPFLVLQGTMDKHVLSDKMDKFMHDNFKNVEFHLWDHCGHAPFFDKQEEFNKVTLEWVDRITKVTVSYLSFSSHLGLTPFRHRPERDGGIGMIALWGQEDFHFSTMNAL